MSDNLTRSDIKAGILGALKAAIAKSEGTIAEVAAREAAGAARLNKTGDGTQVPIEVAKNAQMGYGPKVAGTSSPKVPGPMGKVTPPDVSEKVVHKLKDEYGHDEAGKRKAFATAWKIHNEKAKKSEDEPNKAERTDASHLLSPEHQKAGYKMTTHTGQHGPVVEIHHPKRGHILTHDHLEHGQSDEESPFLDAMQAAAKAHGETAKKAEIDDQTARDRAGEKWVGKKPKHLSHEDPRYGYGDAPKTRGEKEAMKYGPPAKKAEIDPVGQADEKASPKAKLPGAPKKAANDEGSGGLKKFDLRGTPGPKGTSLAMLRGYAKGVGQGMHPETARSLASLRPGGMHPHTAEGLADVKTAHTAHQASLDQKTFNPMPSPHPSSLEAIRGRSRTAPVVKAEKPHKVSYFDPGGGRSRNVEGRPASAPDRPTKPSIIETVKDIIGLGQYDQSHAPKNVKGVHADRGTEKAEIEAEKPAEHKFESKKKPSRLESDIKTCKNCGKPADDHKTPMEKAEYCGMEKAAMGAGAPATPAAPKPPAAAKPATVAKPAKIGKGEMVKLPDGSGFATGTVGKKPTKKS